MADTEFSALATTTSLVSTDQLLVVRGGVPYRFTGVLPAIAVDGSLEAASTSGISGVRLGAQNNGSVSLAGTPDALGSYHAGMRTVRHGASGYSSTLLFMTEAKATANTTDTSVERARIDGDGNFLIGATVGTSHAIFKNATLGGQVLAVAGAAGDYSLLCYATDLGLYNAAAAGAKIGRNSVTGRSLNAGGTINASGADYAEYMTKAPGCGTIAKGDVCGVDQEGELTRTWADAISFVVKSTDPAYRGGDTWGAGLEGDDLEQARGRVDSIAFCGRVPVNVDADTLATCEAALGEGAGIYLVATANGGGIKAAAVPESEMTLPLYMRRLGKVWAIRDGRPIMDVQHG